MIAEILSEAIGTEIAIELNKKGKTFTVKVRIYSNQSAVEDKAINLIKWSIEEVANLNIERDNILIEFINR